MKIKIGSRGSKLALIQSEEIKQALLILDPTLEIEIKTISTKGDRILDKPLAQIGDKGLFIQEIETGLLEGTIDLAVHSLKDVPSTIDPSFELFYFSNREDPRDVFVSNATNFKELPAGSIIGTGSIRRIMQLKKIRSDLIYKDIRGNVPTRLEKLDRGEYDGLVLAAAGLHRLNLANRITQYFSIDQCVPACGQGILALEVLKGNPKISSLLEKLEEQEIRLRATIERQYLFSKEGSCHLPIGAYYESETHRLYTVSGTAEKIIQECQEKIYD